MKGAGPRVTEGVARAAPFRFTLDGEPVEAYPGVVRGMVVETQLGFEREPCVERAGPVTATTEFHGRHPGYHGHGRQP